MNLFLNILILPTTWYIFRSLITPRFSFPPLLLSLFLMPAFFYHPNNPQVTFSLLATLVAFFLSALIKHRFSSITCFTLGLMLIFISNLLSIGFLKIEHARPILEKETLFPFDTFIKDTLDQNIYDYKTDLWVGESPL